MTIAIIVLLILAAIAAVAREFVWMDKFKENNWKHNDKVKNLNIEKAMLEAACEKAVVALKEANLEVMYARLQVEKASG